MNFWNLKVTTQEEKGFTLVEALVSFAILTLALAAFISSTTTAMESFKHAEKMHLASKIANEGIEMVINKKDNHTTCYKRGGCSDWRDNFPAGSFEVSSARPEELLPGEQFSGYDDTGWKPRNICFLDSAGGGGGGIGLEGKFGYCTGPGNASPHVDGDGDVIPGNFKREVKITSLGDGGSPNNPDGFQVDSIVRWEGGNEISLRVYLYGI